MSAETKNCPYCGEVVLAVAIKCKHCHSGLSGPPAAPLAPAPRDETEDELLAAGLRRGPRTNLIKLVVAAAVSVVVLAVAGGSLMSSTPTSEEARRRPAAFSLSAEELLQQVADNRLDLSDLRSKYKGKLVQVTQGYMGAQPLAADGGGAILAIVKSPSSGTSRRRTIHCWTLKSENAVVASLKQDDQVNVKGTVADILPDGEIFSGVNMKDCVLVP